MRFARLLQASGVLIACVGLAGYWLTRSEGPTPLGAAQQELVGTDTDDFHVSFLIAGRDVHYGRGEVEPVYDEAGEIVEDDGEAHLKIVAFLEDLKVV